MYVSDGFFFSKSLNLIGCDDNTKGFFFQTIFFSIPLELNTHVYYINPYINCVYYSFDMSTFIAMQTKNNYMKAQGVPQ